MILWSLLPWNLFLINLLFSFLPNSVVFLTPLSFVMLSSGIKPLSSVVAWGSSHVLVGYWCGSILYVLWYIFLGELVILARQHLLVTEFMPLTLR